MARVRLTDLWIISYIILLALLVCIVSSENNEQEQQQHQEKIALHRQKMMQQHLQQQQKHNEQQQDIDSTAEKLNVGQETMQSSVEHLNPDAEVEFQISADQENSRDERGGQQQQHEPLEPLYARRLQQQQPQQLLEQQQEQLPEWQQEQQLHEQQKQEQLYKQQEQELHEQQQQELREQRQQESHEQRQQESHEQQQQLHELQQLLEQQQQQLHGQQQKQQNEQQQQQQPLQNEQQQKSQEGSGDAANRVDNKEDLPTDYNQQLRDMLQEKQQLLQDLLNHDNDLKDMWKEREELQEQMKLLQIMQDLKLQVQNKLLLQPPDARTGQDDEDPAQTGSQQVKTGFAGKPEAPAAVDGSASREEFADFPEPFSPDLWTSEDVKEIIRNRISATEMETAVIYKPDQFGQVKMEKYVQTKMPDGKIELEYSQHFENVPELVTHKNVMDKYNERIASVDKMSKSRVEGESGESKLESGGSEEDKQEPPLTEEQKRAQALYDQAQVFLSGTTNKKSVAKAYDLLSEAAGLGHDTAMEKVAFAHMFGDHRPLNLTRARLLFERLAEKGVPRGQLGLALIYTSGLAVNSSQAKALVYLTFSALGGDPLAQMALGYRYWAGVTVEANCETALTYYRKVAAKVAEDLTITGGTMTHRVRLQDEVESSSSQGGAMLDNDLIQYYQFLADKGDVQAQVGLGQLFYQGGRGVDVNHEAAQNYFIQAADAGNANAMAFLGKMYLEGSPPLIKQSNETAYNYFRKSADKNNPMGQSGMGLMYLYGRGVEKDHAKALKYFTLSAEQGWVDGQLQLGIMYHTGLGVRRDYKQALKYFTLASQSGHVLAYYNLGQMHSTGTGVLRNCQTAAELFKNVAERGSWSDMIMDAQSLYREGRVDSALLMYSMLAELGYEVAQSNVAFILDHGLSHLFNKTEMYQRAFLHWNRAASQGYTVARVKIGDYHYYGYGTGVDYEMAATHYRMASEQQHNAQAMFNLGYMHERGLGMRQDIHLAKRFYDMAAESSVDAQIPVMLALSKLSIYFLVDYIKDHIGFYRSLDIRLFFGPYWDIYLTILLALLIGFILLIRNRA